MRAKWDLHTVNAGNLLFKLRHTVNPAMLYSSLISEAAAMIRRCEADAQYFSSMLLGWPCN